MLIRVRATSLGLGQQRQYAKALTWGMHAYAKDYDTVLLIKFEMICWLTFITIEIYS